MSRIATIEPESATGEVKHAFDAVRASFGTIPNGVKVLAASPQTLRGYLRFSAAVAGGALSRAERERVAILTARAMDVTIAWRRTPLPAGLRA